MNRAISKSLRLPLVFIVWTVVAGILANLFGEYGRDKAHLTMMGPDPANWDPAFQAAMEGWQHQPNPNIRRPSR